MQTATIKEVMSWPDQTPVDSIRLTITGAYEHKEKPGNYGPYTVQNAEAVDAAGDKIRLSIWDHSDVTPLKGREVILSSSKGRGGLEGVRVKHGQYTPNSGPDQGKVKKTVELEVKKKGQFQGIEGYRQNNPDKAVSEPAPSQGTPAASNARNEPQKGPYVDPRAEGQRLGMCFKLAGDFYLKAAELDGGLTEAAFLAGVKDLTPKLIALSKELEGHG
jgi:hypothetical protein